MKRYCPNCYYPLSYKAKFCAHCGQKTKDGKVSVGDLLKQVWFRVLHLESRSLRVLGRLFIPGQATLDFFNGKRNRYPHPVRFFFIVMFFFLFTLNHYVAIKERNFQLSTKEGRGVHITPNDTIVPPKDLYQLGQRYTRLQRFRSEFDSLPPAHRTPEIRAALDSLFRRVEGDADKEFAKIFSVGNDSLPIRPPDSLPFNLGLKQLKVPVADVFEHDAEYLIRKYQFTNWSDKMLLRQGMKSVKEPQSLVRAYIGSLAWTLLVLVAFMAGVLTLLYIRRKRYYVEHFIFLLHEHTTLFLLLTAAILLAHYTRYDILIWSLLLCWVLVEPVLAFKRFYGQGWIKTILKAGIFSVLYVAGFAVLFFGSVIVVFILF